MLWLLHVYPNSHTWLLYIHNMTKNVPEVHFDTAKLLNPIWGELYTKYVSHISKNVTQVHFDMASWWEVIWRRINQNATLILLTISWPSSPHTIWKNTFFGVPKNTLPPSFSFGKIYIKFSPNAQWHFWIKNDRQPHPILYILRKFIWYVCRGLPLLVSYCNNLCTIFLENIY